MVEGKIEIFLSYKEPNYKDNLLWLRPYLDREGYELLYYGANGWTKLILCGEHSSLEKECNSPLESIEPHNISCMTGKLYEITSSMEAPEVKPSCRCPNQ